MPEKKFFNRHMELTILNTSRPNGDPSSVKSYTNALDTLAYPGVVNHWVAFRYAPEVPSDMSNLYAFPNNQATGTPTKSAGRGYNDSPFALTIPQGTGTGERIGRDVSVVKDSWYFRFTFPRLIPGDNKQSDLTPGTLFHQRFLPLASLGTLTSPNLDYKFDQGFPIVSQNLSQRPVRVRLVCIFEKQCDSPGEFGFTPSELFESQYDIHSRFSRDQANGYKIVFDRTQTCTLMDNLGVATQSATGLDATAQDDKASSGPYEVRFKVNIPPYLRRYEGVTSPDQSTGYEVITSGGVIGGGVSKGALTWYAFIEDQYCPMSISDAAPGTINSSIYSYTPEIINIEIDRKTFWIDP